MRPRGLLPAIHGWVAGGQGTAGAELSPGGTPHLESDRQGGSDECGAGRYAASEHRCSTTVAPWAPQWPLCWRRDRGQRLLTARRSSGAGPGVRLRCGWSGSRRAVPTLVSTVRPTLGAQDSAHGGASPHPSFPTTASPSQTHAGQLPPGPGPPAPPTPIPRGASARRPGLELLGGGPSLSLARGRCPARV